MPNTKTRRQFIQLGIMGIASCYAFSTLGACTRSTEGTDDGAQLATTVLFAFDTVVEISAYCEQSLVDAAAQRCEYFESIFSRTLEGSDIYTVNQAGGARVEVHAETADIIDRALAYSAASNGLFDITIGAATELWDFKSGVIPDSEVLAEAVTHIDYTKVSVEGNIVTLADPAMRLDLGSIAKGYIADDLAQLFVDGGCQSAFINLGGNVFALGEKPDGSAWNVGIQDPNDASGTAIAKTPVRNKSVVTSGLYERSFTADGVLYYHILDPKTGYPAVTDLESSTIISDASIDGDAYSTVAFLLGADAALEMIEADPAFEGILIDKSGTITSSSNADITLL